MKLPRVILLHGFNVRDGGERTVGRLREYLAKAGFENVNMPSYGWFDLFATAGFNDNFARFLAGMSEPDDIVIGHSNGCAMAYRAMMDFPKICGITRAVFINPALKPKVRLPEKLKSLQVWHSPSDKPVTFARIFSPFTLWGNMGAVGYQRSSDTRVTNFNKQDNFPKSSKGHSDVFSDGLIEYFGPLIVSELKSTIP